MANIYKDAQRRGKVPPGGVGATQEAPEAVEEVTVPVVPEEPEKPTEGDRDLFKYVKKEKKKRPAKNSHTLNLSDSVWVELNKRSKKEGLTASKYLDALLKGVFEL